jgi:RNA polymerase subunit RPABC4/transcription elongation factor Spt4
MSLISCKECSGQVSDSAATCPHCGAPVLATKESGQRIGVAATVQPEKKGGVWKWVIGVPVVLFIFMMLMSGSDKAKYPGKSQDRAVYETCMDSLKADDRARGGNGAFIAGACEKIRNDYIQKYGTTP